MEKINIENELLRLSDEKYKKFSTSLCHDTKREILGIKVPVLRNLAKELLKEYSLEELLKMINEDYFEEVQLKGFCIAYSKIEFDEKIEIIKKYIPLIDSWAITDTFIPTLKIKKCDLDKYFDVILEYLDSKKEFEVRYAVISMLDYFITDEYVHKVLKLLDKIDHDGYYVKMAVAWTICEIGIKYNDLAMEYLTGKNNLDKFTYNKSLQKMIESRRILSAQKDILREMKRKE